MNKTASILIASGLISMFNTHASTKQVDRPNILFLVIEDTSPYLFPAYGNPTIKTPHIDELANDGVIFTNAFSNGSQCSPARSTLISGTQATTYGNDFHRQSHIVPEQYFFPAKLREAGYFTLNAGKTDYNITKQVAKKYYSKVWDKMSGYRTETQPNVSYNDPERGDKPFFAQFNNPTSHMSRMTTITLNDRYPTIVDPNEVVLPPHVPDLPAVRADYALHLDGIVNTDRWVGVFLDDLEKRGLKENTIIFFFSDHGGCLPRGKAFPYETAFRPALIIWAPEKWQHLLPSKPGTKCDRIVEFADFGPTLLSIAGVPTPEYMTGKPFMGSYKTKPKKYAHNFRANTGYHFDPSRAVTNGRYKYIRYFTPYKIHALRQNFQFGMPAQLAWDSLYYSGNSKAEYQQYYEPKPNEMFFDIKKDSFELNNLANNPKYRKKIQAYRKEMTRFMHESKDIGLFPSDMRIHFTKKGIDLYSMIRKENYDLDKLHNLVLKASSNQLSDLDFLIEHLNDDLPEIRFWAASGIANLAQLHLLSTFPADLYQLLDDPFASVAAVAAEAMVYGGDSETGLNTLLSLIKKGSDEAVSSVEELRNMAFPIADELYRYYHSNSKNAQRFGIRSILINFKMLPFNQLFTENNKQAFMQNYQKRIKEWGPTRP